MDLVREHTRTHSLEMNLHVYLKKEKLKVNIFMHTRTCKRMDAKKIGKDENYPYLHVLMHGRRRHAWCTFTYFTILYTILIHSLKILNLDEEKKCKEYEHFYSRLMRKVRERARKQHAAILHSALAAIRLFGHLNPHTPSSNYCMYIIMMKILYINILIYMDVFLSDFASISNNIYFNYILNYAYKVTFLNTLNTS